MSEPVSPADTIRRVLSSLGVPRYGRYERPQVHDGFAALDALLAVGERDKAEIELLYAERDSRDDALASLETILFGDDRVRSRDELDARAEEFVKAGARDGRQIAQLTEALAGTNELAAAILSHRGHASIGICLEEVLANAAAIQTICERAVLADEEDANG